MITIDTVITVDDDGSIHINPQLGLSAGEHRAVLIVDETPMAAASERERVREKLRAAGLLREISLEERALAAQSTLTLDKARAILDRAGGKPLSELILEMRGPKA